MGIGRWLPLALGAALALGAQQDSRPSRDRNEFAPPDDEAADGSETPDDQAAIRATELLRVTPAEATAACPLLAVTAEGTLARAAAARCSNGVLVLPPGRWTLTAAEPPPPPLAARYEKLEIALRITGGEHVSIEIDDRSRFKKTDRSFCARLAEADGGPSLSGLRIRFHQRYRVVGEGLTDERGKFCADHLGAWPVTVSVNGGADFRDAAATFPADGDAGTIELAREERVSCRIDDPHGFLRAHPGARFAIRSRTSRRDTALSPGAGLPWNFWGDQRRDTVSFGILPGDLPPDDGKPWPPPAGAEPAGGKSPPTNSPGDRAPPAAEPDAAEDGGDEPAPDGATNSSGKNSSAADGDHDAPAAAPKPAAVSPLDEPEGMEIFLVGDEMAPPLARFTLSPRALRRACVLPLPKPARRAIQVTVACPPGKVVSPLLPLVLSADRKPASPGEAASEILVVAGGQTGEVSRERRFTVTLPSEGDYRFWSFFPKQGGSARPLRPDDRGEDRVELPPDRCLGREFADQIADNLLMSRGGNPPPRDPEKLRAAEHAACLDGLPITRAERDALRREGASLSCDALQELLMREGGEAVAGMVID